MFLYRRFETVRRVSINPQGSLGWSTSFIQYGLRAILLYLYESTKMTEAVSEIAGYLRLVLYTKKNLSSKIYSGFFYIKLKLFLLEPEMK